MPVAIRSATLDDVPAILGIAQRAASAAHWAPEEYNKLIRDGIVLVAEQAKKLCGFVSAKAMAGDWEIENVVVTGDLLRQGIATRLLREVIERARRESASVIHLEVRESNRPARALYESLEFLAIGRRPAYYRDPAEDAILYVRRL